MADGMCGPSNPLQNFQKHSTTDRTLHQDRLVSRPSPSQGFRSSPGPNSQHLDPEFEAFQAGQLPLDHGFQHQQYAAQPGFNQQPQPVPSAWASDFQHLNISSPPSQFHQQPYIPQQAQQRHDTGGWHQDFARQQGGMGMQGQAMGQQMNGQANSQYRYSSMSGMGMAPQYSGGYMGQQAEMPIAQQKQPAEAFDEEAFARAFEQAAATESALQEASHPQQVESEAMQKMSPGVEMGQDIMINESAERLMAASEGPLNQERIGADTVEDPKTQEPEVVRENNSPDALARTAGELLRSVRHDRSDKFKNSQFLELMRQFRDKEVRVEGDRIVAVGTNNAYANANAAEGAGSEGMAGISEGEEAIKATITSLLEKLREVALDPEKPFMRTPQNTRTILHLLITLHTLPIPAKFSTTLQALSKHPILSQIPSIQEILNAIRHMHLRVQGGSVLWHMRNRARKLCKKADGGVFFASNGEEEEEEEDDVVARWQRECFAESKGVADDDLEARVARIRARVAELTGNAPVTTTTTTTTTTTKTSSKEDAEEKAMWGVLGYTIQQTGDQELDRQLVSIHRRRMEDILGPSVVKVKQLCEECGIWRPELGLAEFRVLVMNFEDEGTHDWTSFPWDVVADSVEARVAGRETEGKEETGMVLEVDALRRQLVKNGVRLSLPDGLSVEETLKRARAKMELFKEGKLRSLEELRTPHPVAASERFRARRAAKEELRRPQEMRDMAEESVERVKTRED